MGGLVLKWLWSMAPPLVLVVACNWLFPSLVLSTERENWIRLVAASFAVQAVLAGWAGWRVVRRDAGGAWAAALAGGTTQLAWFVLIFGLAFATGPFRPIGFQEVPVPSWPQLGGLALQAGTAAALGLGGGALASLVQRRHAI